MERQLLRALYQLLRQLTATGSSGGCRYSDFWILLTYFWSVLSDRPISWACRADNWPAGFESFTPPSPATMSRRLHRPVARWLLVRVLQYLQQFMALSNMHYIDAKPLCVGGSSGDRDARIGWGAARLAKGYKIHAIIQASGRLQALAIEPMNRNDTSMAPALIDQLRLSPGYLVGDTAYDADRLYDQAAAHGLQLVATPRVAKKGLGHKRHSPRRLAGLEIARSLPGQQMLRDRFCIDRHFGHWGNLPGGLWGLPNFVRHLDRVRCWVLAKLSLVSLLRLPENKHLRHR